MLDKLEAKSDAKDQQKSEDKLKRAGKRLRSHGPKRLESVDPLTGLELDDNYGLRQPTREDWEHQSKEIVDRYYAQAESDYFLIVNNYLDEANRAIERYNQEIASHIRWRIGVIVGTGLLAAINACAAFELMQVPSGIQIFTTGGSPRDITIAVILTAIAAVYAALLTMAGTAESFLNKGEKAAGFRESHDLLVSRYRGYCFKWLHYVEAYGKTGAACMNAGQLYRQLVDSDPGLRNKLKQLTEVGPQRKS